MNIERSTTIGHLREIAQKLDGKFKAGGKVQQATTSFIGKAFSLGVKIFSMSQRIFGSKKNVQAGGDVTPKLLDFSNGKFKLDATNAKSFWDSLRTYGAKFIVNQLTDKEIFGLINSEFLSIPQKMQICNAYEGRGKKSLNALFSNHLKSKLGHCITESEIEALGEALMAPGWFANRIALVFLGRTESKKDFSCVLDFFGPQGVFPLQDLPKEYQECLHTTMNGMKLDTILEGINWEISGIETVEALEQLKASQKEIEGKISKAQKAAKELLGDAYDEVSATKYDDAVKALEQLKASQKEIEGKILKAKIKQPVINGGIQKMEELKQKRNEIVSGFCGLKYALEVISEGKAKETIEEEMTVVKNNFEGGQINSHSKSGSPTDDYIKFLIALKGKVVTSEIFSGVSNVFNALIAPKPTPLEKALDQVLTKDTFEVESGVATQQRSKAQVKSSFQNLVNPGKPDGGFELFIKFCKLNQLDPTPVLSLYPKTTFDVFKSMAEQVLNDNGERSPQIARNFFARIGILTEIGDRAESIFPPLMGEKLKNFSVMFRTPNEIGHCREAFALAGTDKEIVEIFGNALELIKREQTTLQENNKTILQFFEALAKEQNWTV